MTIQLASTRTSPSSINPRFFDPIAMFPPIKIPDSWMETKFMKKISKKRYRKKEERSSRIYLVRNAEPAVNNSPRSKIAFSDFNCYSKLDPDQAIVKVTRSGGAKADRVDPPLTRVGYLGAQLVGRSLTGLNIHTVYSSPSLRCIQTAASITSCLNQKVRPRIRVEYGLYEPLPFGKVPNFLSAGDLLKNGFTVDDNYKPLLDDAKLKKLTPKERRPSNFYERIERVAEWMDADRNKDGGIIVIAHASVIDAVYRFLTKRRDFPKSFGDVQRLAHNYPRCSVTTLEWNVQKTEWLNQIDAVPPLSYWHVTTMVNIPEF